MLQSLVNWAMALTDAQRYGIIAIFWACVMVGLLVMVWNDPEMWTKPEDDGKKHAEPRPRPEKPRRSMAVMDIWKLGVYDVTVMAISFMPFFVAIAQFWAITQRDYSTEVETYVSRREKWEANAMQGSPPRIPTPLYMDVAAASFVFCLGVVVFLVGAVPLYRSYQTILYGKEVHGTSDGVVADWTMSIWLICSRKITYKYVPDGGEAAEVNSWKGLPGESWFENKFPKGATLRVIYDEACPSRAVLPELVGVEPVDIAAVQDKKEQ